MSGRLYGYASAHGIDTGIVRIGGIGLGNLLFSWARCALFCRAHGATQIYTAWPQFNPEFWLYWDPDKRHYARSFRPLPDEVRGLEKLRLLASLPKVKESERDQQGRDPGRDRVVVFRGLGNFFQDIPASEYSWLRTRLLASIRDQRLLEQPSEPHIGVHVRLGDKPLYNPDIARTTNMRAPIEWYTHVIQCVAAELNWSGEVGVCSDATEKELLPVLRLPNVRLMRGRTAVEDLLYLASSRALIGSFSTFSQWAAYLSGQPSVWHPQFNRMGGLGNGSHEMTISQEAAPDEQAWRALRDGFERGDRRD